MEYIVKKSNIPVLWLDTFVITQMANAIFQNKQKQDCDEKLLEQYIRLVQLRAAKKIIIFESDQLLEIAVRKELTRVSGRVLTQLSGGLIVRSWEVREKQFMQALSAFAENSTTGTIHWDDIYSDDPLKDKSVLGILIRCDVGVDARLNQKKQANKAVYDNWLKVQKQYAGAATRTNFQKQLELERRGVAKLAQDVILKFKNGDLTEWHPLYCELIKKPSLYLKSRMTNIVDLESTVTDFYESSYYTNLPVNDISFTLFAEKLCGNEKLKQGDQTDIDNISAFLPYVNYMIIDKSMADKVNKHKLGEKYNTRIIRLKELDEVIEAAEAVT